MFSEISDDYSLTFLKILDHMMSHIYMISLYYFNITHDL